MLTGRGTQGTHHIGTECVLRACPLPVDLPGGLCGEGGEREPVVVLVLLQVRKGDEQKSSQLRCRLVLDDALPDLVRDVVKERGLVRVLEVLDRVEVLERAMRRDRVLRYPSGRT